MTEAEVSGDFSAVLRRIGYGEEIVVDRNGHPVAIIKPADPEPRTFSELVVLAEQREKARGYPIPLDEDYAAETEQLARERKPWTPRSWE